MDRFSHIYKKLFTVCMLHQVYKHFDRKHEQFFFWSPLGDTSIWNCINSCPRDQYLVHYKKCVPIGDRPLILRLYNQSRFDRGYMPFINLSQAVLLRKHRKKTETYCLKPYFHKQTA